VGDKATAKAMTGAYKYALRQTFCIETGDDPDKDPSVDQERASKPFKEFDPADGQASPLVREAREAAAEHGLPTDEFGPPHPAEEIHSQLAQDDDLTFDLGTKASIPEGGRHMQAKFSGSCKRCDAPLDEGDTIYYHRDSKAAYCAVGNNPCAPEGVTA
jgi:hypothetical protein